MQLSSDKSLKDKLGVDLDRLKKDSNGAQNDHFNDGLSDDEEYQNMSEKERNERMRAKLNMDGAIEVSDSDSDFEPSPKRKLSDRKANGNAKKRRLDSESSDDYDDAANGNDDQSMELPDIPEDDSDDDGPKMKKEVEAEKEKPAPRRIEDILTEEQRKNLVIPSKVPAVCGVRRRPTLIVTPATLIPHWIEQIQMHVDPRVELKGLSINDVCNLDPLLFSAFWTNYCKGFMHLVC